ncbi:MAG: alpha/beta hydrolase [Myxococcota bacterium]
MTIVGIFLTLILLIIIHNYVVFRYFEIKWSPDEIHYITAQDGFRLAAGRRIPDKRRFKEPVILCHGLGANRYNLDLNQEYSLARRFTNMGYDTYIIEMRTVGLSSKPHLFSDTRWDIYFDDIVKYDVPAFIHNAKIKSNSEKVLWVGHSLGGMIMYAACQNKEIERDVKALVTISSPPSFIYQKELKRFIPLLKSARLFSHIKQEFWGRLFALYISRAIPYSEVAANLENIDTPILRRIFVNLATDISSTLLNQIAQWLETGYIKDRNLNTNFSEGIKDIEIPIYAMTGSVDMMCPPDAVLSLKEKLKDKELKITIAGIQTGFSTDYGHGDIIFGRKAPEEIFPLITSYIEAHSTKII